jgi:NRAMP (natural resistance-associated macrophage protein)-like metal ion transporter
MPDRAPVSEQTEVEKERIPKIPPAAGTGTLEAAISHEINPLKRFLKILGPGFVTGASDDDPSGVGTYAVAGASFGYATLWTSLFTYPLMASVQFMSAKIGMVSGRGIAGVLRHHYSKKLLYPCVFALVIANTINAGADIGAIAAAFELLTKLSAVWFIVPVTILILVLQVWGSYRLIANVFKWLTLALLAYVGSAFFSHPNMREVLMATFVPKLTWNGKYLATLVAILGTTISPYLFFWQSNQEVEEEITMGRTSLWQRQGATEAELKYAALDVNIGMLFSNLVMYFIICSTAATLFKAGHTDIQTAADAAQALRPIAGAAAEVLLAIGLLGAGFLAVPILTGSSAYAVAESLGWKHGLDKKPWQAKEFYSLIAVSTFIAMLVNFLGISPIKALFWSAVLNGLLAPPVLVVVMLVANNRNVLGDRVNGRWLNLLGWATVLLMTCSAVGFFLTLGQ